MSVMNLHRLGLAIITCGLLTAADTARAEVPPCRLHFTFYGNQHTQGTLDTKAGEACSSRIWVNSVTTITSIQLLQRPANGRALATGPSTFRFQPNKGFKGQDAMTIRINATGAKGKGWAVVTLRISVD
jgi:hypothetical protein